MQNKMVEIKVERYKKNKEQKGISGETDVVQNPSVGTTPILCSGRQVTFSSSKMIRAEEW